MLLTGVGENCNFAKVIVDKSSFNVQLRCHFPPLTYNYDAILRLNYYVFRLMKDKSSIDDLSFLKLFLRKTN